MIDFKDRPVVETGMGINGLKAGTGAGHLWSTPEGRTGCPFCVRCGLYTTAPFGFNARRTCPGYKSPFKAARDESKHAKGAKS